MRVPTLLQELATGRFCTIHTKTPTFMIDGKETCGQCMINGSNKALEKRIAADHDPDRVNNYYLEKNKRGTKKSTKDKIIIKNNPFKMGGE